MGSSKLRTAAQALAVIACMAAFVLLRQVAAEEGGPTGLATVAQTPAITPEQFEKVHKLILPQPGESRWMDIAWQTSLWQARQKAAEEGKPMFVWSGSGGAPCAPT